MDRRKPPAEQALVTNALVRLWPVPCPECTDRPAVACIAVGEDAPYYPEGRCPQCEVMWFSVPVIIGVDCDAL